MASGLFLEVSAILTFMCLAVVLVYYGIVQYREAGRFRTEKEPLNLFLMAAILLFLVFIVEIKVDFTLDGTPGMYPGLVISLIPIFLVGTLFVTNLVQHLRGVPKRRRYGVEVDADAPMEVTRKLDRNRKVFHLFIFVTIFVVLFICDAALKAGLAGATTVEDRAYYQEKVDTFWGATDGLGYVEGVFRYEALAMGRAVVILYFYVLSAVFLMIELTRLSDRVHFPLHKSIQKTLRYKELDSIASYTHFAVGYCFAALLLPPMEFLAALSLTSFADAAASTIGIKYGKHRFQWNGKSIEGCLAGFALAFAPCVLFVGWFYALVAGVVFVLIDLVSPKPLAVSDNILIPVLTSLAFVGLSLLQVPASSIFF
ncbi:MAG: diacylglycerol/polyprenol kinase family protein [Promethearchaeota archaeon]